MVLISSQLKKEQRLIAQKCNGLDQNQYNFIDCNGYIVVNKAWDSPYIYFYDHIDSYEIAGVDSDNDYLFIDGKYFVLNKHISTGTISNEIETNIYIKTKRNGQLENDYYKNLDEVPAYTIIESSSGNVSRYIRIDQVPEIYQKYFLEL